MNMRLSIAALCLPSLLWTTACVIPIGGAEVGDLRVTWTFERERSGNSVSQRCAEVGVNNVTVQLIETDHEGEGPALAFGQTAACIAGSMVIADVVAGKYTMTAVGDGDVAIFDNGAGVPVEVIGNQETPAQAALVLVNGDVVGSVEFPYTFGGDPGCADAGVTTLIAEVVEDGLVIAGNTDIQCGQGAATVANIRVRNGSVPELNVRAVDSNGNIRFRTAAPIRLEVLQAGQVARINTVDLVPTLVTASVRYTFGGVQFCGPAGVATVAAQLRDPATGLVVVPGQNVDCVAGRVDFINVPAGVYDLHLDGLDGNGVVQFTKDVLAQPFDKDSDLGVVDLDPLSSQVVVRFRLPAGETCASLGIGTIDLTILDEDGGITGVATACVAGEVTLTGPAPGVATFSAEGIAGADVILAGELDASLQAGRNIVTLVLVPVRSLLDLSWSFNLVQRPNVTQNTVLTLPSTSCRDADIDNVLVTVSRGSQLLESVTVPCDARRVQIAALPIAAAPVTIKLEGLREQEGDSIFEVTQTIALAGPRTLTTAVLAPSIVFARVVWNGDCSQAGATTVDIQVRANSAIAAGINVPCAQGTALIALPRGTESSVVSITLRGVDGQGAPVGAAPEAITATAPVGAVPGINTFRFAGPTQ